MEKERRDLLVLIFFSSFVLKPVDVAGANNDNCLPASCGPYEPEVRFPFYIPSQQPARCGFPGFDLSCDHHNRTIIRLPSSRSYIVNRISYVSQAIYVDPEFCLPNRVADVDIKDTPFSYNTFWQSYTFYNCSLQSFVFTYEGWPFVCLSKENYSVIASTGSMPSNCKVMKTIVVPARTNTDFRDELELMWFTPFCKSCEREGRSCRLNGDDGETICVRSSHGIPTSAKYGLSIGVIGVPALIMCIVGLVCYTSSRVQDSNNTHNQSIDISSIAITRRLATRTGLDGPTIESYPKTVLGESCRLPDDDDAICAICLSDYKPKESLRTIPECNHYFHSECIDEWLKFKATCPMCRNTQDSSALVTPSSLALSSLTSIESR